MKTLSERIDEELKSRQKKLSDETTEGASGGSTAEVVGEPHKKSEAEMNQNPQEVLEGEAASGDTENKTVVDDMKADPNYDDKEKRMSWVSR